MKILFFGDIVGRPGREALAKILPDWRARHGPDFVLANGENLAHGAGVNAATLEEITALGIDVVTSGNHIFDRRDTLELLADPSKPLLRPANWGKRAPGRGWMAVEKRGLRLAIANLMGMMQFRPHAYGNPFLAVEEVLREIETRSPGVTIIVDFHAEATSEKKAMGWFLDGKVAAVIGTHTHIPTRDERILPAGTAYITDVGMVGAYDSVLGFKQETIINNSLSEPQLAFEIAEGQAEVNAALIEVSDDVRKAESITHLREIV